MLTAAPMLPVALAFGAGLGAAPWLGLGSPWLIAGAGIPLIAAALLLAAGRERMASGAFVVAVVALGALRGAGSALPPEHIAATDLPPAVTVEGVLAEEPVRWAPDRIRLLLDVDGVVDGDTRRPATGQVQLTVYGETAPLGEGQRVSADVRLHRPVGFRNPGGFDYPAHLRREGILLVGSGRGDRLRPLTADSPPWPARVKRWAVATIGSQLPEASAALLAGLLLGERTALPRETDEAFRRAGVYHVLAVSGFNVALLASSVFFTLSLIGVPRRPTALVAGLTLVAFALVVGGQPSVLRATIMGLLLLLGVLLERESQLMNALAWAALAVLLWRPGDLWEPGFQLSFAATAGIIHLTPTLGAMLAACRCPHSVATALAVSLGAQCAVTPIMLVHFNQLSLVGVLANLVVVPIAAAGTSLGLLALLLALLSEAAGALLFNFLWALLLVLRLSVWAAASVPAAMVHLPAPGWPAMAAWFGAAALVPFLRTSVRARAALAVLLALALALSLWPWLRPGDGRLRVVFLDVGQGDAALVEVPEGQRLLVDGGPGGARRFDVGERVLAPFLWNRPARGLDAVAVSHSDPDHSGGLAAVLRRFPVGEVWENGQWGAGSEETLGALARSAVPRRVLHAGERLWLGSALITVLNPDPLVPPASENDASLVFRLDWRGISLLFTGDLGTTGESRLLEGHAPLGATILKVAHHGSRSGSSRPFLEASRPALAVISVGARNPFRHPAPETLHRLEETGSRIYRTDRDGAVVLETDGVTLLVTRWATGVTETFCLGPQSRSEEDHGETGAGSVAEPPCRP